MMSAPVLTLPDRANVEFLKKEARDLHKAFRAGAADAIDRIVTFLPRAMNLPMKASTDELWCSPGRWEVRWGTNHRTWSRQREQLRSNQVNEYMMRATRVQQHREIR